MHGSKHHTSAVITQTIKAIALLLNHTKGKKKMYTFYGDLGELELYLF